jgi:hypothetical protein
MHKLLKLRLNIIINQNTDAIKMPNAASVRL